MPPKVKVTKENIIETAIELVRMNGADAINARAIASRLNCSTQPVFSNFATMAELMKDVIAAAYGRYLSYIEDEVRGGEYPQYKAFGMAYIRFAEEESELFKLLFMRDRQGEDLSPTQDYSDSVKLIMEANGLSREKAELMHLEMWASVHGIATMIATSFLKLDRELISTMLTDVYQGVRKVHTREGK